MEQLKYRNGFVLGKENDVWNEENINLLFIFSAILRGKGRGKKKLLAFAYSI